VANYIRDMRI